MCNCKGNPVPSLDNEDMWLIKTALRYATTFDVSEREDFEKLLEKLENGVETDKEQLQDNEQFRKDWYENKPLI